MSVTLTGGQDAGTYTGTADPGCSVGFVGTGMWGVQYSIFEGSTKGQLSNVAVIYQPDDAGTPPSESYAFLDLKVDIGIGPLFDPVDYHLYSIEVHKDGSGSKGTGTMQVNDAGSTAILHMTGTTNEGVGVDLTVNCPAVGRG